MTAHAPGERRRHGRVAEIDLRDVEVGLRLGDGRPLAVAVGERPVVVRLRRDDLLPQDFLALELRLRGLQLRLVLLQRRLRQSHLRLVLVLLDDEQRAAGLDVGTVDIVHGGQEPGHARHEIDRGEGRGLPGEVGVVRRLLQQGTGDGHRRRRGNLQGRLLLTSREDQHGDGQCRAGGRPEAQSLQQGQASHDTSQQDRTSAAREVAKV